MAKIVIYADAHIGHYQSFDRGGSRLRRSLDALSFMLNWCEDHGVQGIIDAGDLLHRKNLIDFTVYNELVKVVEQHDSSRIPYVSLIGNHNMATRNGEYNNLFPLSPFMTVIDTPNCIQVADVVFWFIPYMNTVEDWRQAYAGVVASVAGRGAQHNVLIAHQEITGAKTGTHLYTAKDGVDLETLSPSFDYQLFGHYHKQQWFGQKTAYIGALLQQNFGEEGNPQGFYVLNTERMSLEWIDLPPSLGEFLTVDSIDDAIRHHRGNPQDFIRVFADVENINRLSEYERSGIRIDAPDRSEEEVLARLGTRFNTLDERVEAYIQQKIAPDHQPMVRTVVREIDSGI